MKTSKYSTVKTILLAIGVVLLMILVFFEIQKRNENKEQKEKALIALKQEIENNAQILGIWMEGDDKITIQLDTLIEKVNRDTSFSGRLPTRLSEKEKRKFSTNQSINPFRNGACKALLDSGRAKDLDFEVLHALENLYGSQKALVDICQDIPNISVNSPLDKKFTSEDITPVYKIRIWFSRIQLAESYLEAYFKETFDLPEFEQEEFE